MPWCIALPSVTLPWPKGFTHRRELRVDVDAATWQGNRTMVDRAAGKVKSDEPELWLRLVKTPKLVDMIRSDWSYRGILVKFKLEVDIDEAELLKVAEKARLHSGADWMVANTLDGAADWAYAPATRTDTRR